MRQRKYKLSAIEELDRLYNDCQYQLVGKDLDIVPRGQLSVMHAVCGAHTDKVKKEFGMVKKEATALLLFAAARGYLITQYGGRIFD